MMPEVIRNWLERNGRSRSAVIIGAGVLSVVLILSIARAAGNADWAVLFPAMSLEDVGDVTAKLDEEGIDYRLSRGGLEIEVREPELARARVALARDGLPSSGSPGFELFDQPAWGMTDFTQRINYRRALEGELERTVTEMRGVEAARIHIAMNESSAFRRAAQPSAASVVLTIRSGVRPGEELIEAIASLIASSVDGLSSDHITVLDDSGRLLSAAVEAESLAGLSKRQLKLRRDVETYLERKAEDLIAQTAGIGNAQVRVAADLNFDRLDRTTQTVDPDQQITVREERSEIVPGEGQQGAASAATAAEYEASRSIETFSGAAGSVRRLSVSVLLNDRLAEDGESAVPWTNQELGRVQTLVANAIGLDPTRGDAITVMSAPFSITDMTVEPVASPSPFFVAIPRYRQEIITGIALLLAFIVALQVVKALRSSVSAQSAQAALGAGTAGSLAASTAALPMTSHSTSHSLKGANESPEMAARVLRAWMKE
jgi:flagellar M-ring protein FliF